MSQIKISLVASAIRTQVWNRFYNSLLDNDLQFEVIFVGNVEPNYPLPANFKFIYSPVKIAQCYEIGFRQAQGELVHWTADDAVYTPKALEKIYAFYNNMNGNRKAVGFNCVENGSYTSEGHTIGAFGSPRMIPFGLTSNAYMKALGGYDRRFIAGQAENDLVMRIYEWGGSVDLCKDAIVYIEHLSCHDDTTKTRVWYKESRKFLERCWFIPTTNEISMKRRIPFEPFSNENILTISQEPKGDW